MDNSADLMDLVSVAYSAAVGEGDWVGLLDEFARIFPDFRGSIVVNDTSGGVPRCVSGLFRNTETNLVQEYAEYYVKVNPWQNRLATREVGFVASADLITRDAFRRTEFYNDYCLRWDAHDAFGTVLANSRGQNALLTLLTPDLSERDTAGLRDFLSAFSPHLLNAYRVHQHLLGKESFGLGAESALTASGVAAVIVDGDGYLFFATEAADAILKRGDGLVVSGRRLRAIDPVAQSRMERAIGHMAAPLGAPSDVVHGPFVRIPRKGTGIPYVLHLAVLSQVARSPVLLRSPNKVVVVIRDRDREREVDAGWLVTALGLTPTEGLLVSALVRGETLLSHAAARNVSIETLRKLLRSIFRKTGCHRQSELIALVMTLRT